MAITYRSVATTDFAGSLSSLVITKPSGLTEGDMMIAVIVYDDNADTANTPTGWTNLSQNTTGMRKTVFYKVADSSDVAASNFTFTFTNTVNTAGGSILCWSGEMVVTAGSQTRINSSTNTPTFTTGITPSVANSYLLFIYWSSFTHTVSSYAITTDNPTWVEVTDENKATPDVTMAFAYASRPETSATGNFTCTTSTTHDDHFGQLILLSPVISAEGTHPILTSTSSIFDHDISVGTTARHTILTQPHEIFSQNGKIEENRWTDTEKGNKSWTNQKK